MHMPGSCLIYTLLMLTTPGCSASRSWHATAPELVCSDKHRSAALNNGQFHLISLSRHIMASQRELTCSTFVRLRESVLLIHCRRSFLLTK